jgi:hypothetical protein
MNREPADQRVRSNSLLCNCATAELVQLGGGADVEPGQLLIAEFFMRLLVEGTSGTSIGAALSP